jgi:hypothetical protein
MKSIISLSALVLFVASTSFAGQLNNVHCWEGNKVGSLMAFVNPADSTGGVNAIVACEDEDNCDAPLENYQLSSTTVKDASPDGKTMKVVDAASGGSVFTLTVDTNRKAPARGNGDCTKRNCVEGTLTAKVSIKPSKEMLQRLKDGAHMSCIVGF